MADNNTSNSTTETEKINTIPIVRCQMLMKDKSSSTRSHTVYALCEAIMVREHDSYSNHTYWHCPVCQAQLWPDETRLKEIAEQARADQHEADIREVMKQKINTRSSYGTTPAGGTLIPQIDQNKRGGGNKSGRKSGKSGRKTGISGRRTGVPDNFYFRREPRNKNNPSSGISSNPSNPKP